MDETRRPRMPAARQIVVKPTRFERALSLVSPRLAHQRTMARFRYDILTRGYEGATAGRRAGGWTTTDSSANAEILPALARLRARSRDLVRNNAFASKATRVLTHAMVGTGIVPQFKHADPSVAARALELWKRWAESTQCDADGRNDFYGLERLVTRTMFESGECLIRRRPRRSSDGLAVPLQLQVLEPDFLDGSKDGTEINGNLLIQGIEFDALGRRVAYWLHRTHPGDRMAWRRGESVRVPASEVMHVFEQERPGQARGVPRAAAVIMRLRNFDEYEDAQLQKQIIAACFAAFVVDATGSAPSSPSNAAKESTVESIESGTIETLPSGKDIRFSDPPTVEGYGEFASQILHAVAAGYDVPYELLTGDFSRVNYSSGRMALLGFGRHVDVLTWGTTIPQFCEPALRSFLDVAADAGELPRLPNFSWRAPRRELVSPKEEIPAIKNAVRSGLMTLPQAILELTGEDPDEVLAEIADFNKKMDDLKITLDTDPRKIALAGGEQPSATVAAAE